MEEMQMENTQAESTKIEGRNAVLEAFRSGKTIDKLFVLDGCKDGPIQTILREAKNHDTLVQFVAKERLEQLSETKKHQGVIAMAAAFSYATVEDILENVGDVQGCLVRELTKIHEQKIYGKISELITLSKEPKGEYVIILDLNKTENADEVDFSKMSLEEHYNFYEKLRLDKKEIIKQIAKDRNVSKNEIYQNFITKK